MTVSVRAIVPRLVSWAALVFVLAASAVTLWLIYLVGARLAGEDLRGYAVIAFGLANVLLGGLLVRRVPENLIGWILVFAAVVLMVTEVTTFYGVYALEINPALPAGPIAAWLSTWTAIPAIGSMVTLLILLFPDGRLPSPRWRVMGILTGGYLGLVTIIGAVAAFPNHPGAVRVDEIGSIVPADSLGGDWGLVIAAPFLGLLILCAVAVVALFVRRHHATATVREQLKWFLFVCVVILLFGFVPHFAAAMLSSSWLYYAANAIFIASFVLVPVAAGFAILKYRLYDIDVVISRTLVYGSLAAFITLVYVAIVVGVGTLIGSGGQPNLVLSIVATAIVAVGFQPVRERLQKIANRLVYGKRATPYEVLSQFSERVAETYTAEEALPRMARVLAEGTGAERAQVWLRAGAILRPAATWPDSNGAGPAEPVSVEGQLLPSLPGDQAVPVRHQGELLGALTVTKRQGESLTPIEQKLLDDLAHQAGLVLKNVGLTAELLARLEDLRASRQRLVAAQDEERRRLERNLHDGAQQNLVAIKVKLGLAEMVAAKDPTRAKELIAQLKRDTDEALETLRDLARGIYPPLLADKGLAAALESQARKATIPVAVRVDGANRYPQETEAAVYFCVLEALQNVQKYATATSATVRLGEGDGDLTFVVEDDGRGFDPVTVARGSGLTNMADRLDALGGGIELESAPGAGTRLLGRVPVQETAPA